jgi:RNA polymerase sigma-70 factor (ECF subfamily)
MDDKQIMLRLKESDQKAFKLIFDKHYSLVYQTIARIVWDDSICMDLTQDLFVRFWDKRNSIEIQGEIAPYIRRMAVNEALGYIRKQKKFKMDDIEAHVDLTDNNSSDHVLEAKELQSAFEESILKLPNKCRMVFHLSRHEGLSYKEIAEQMNISIKTVENQMGKALKMMRFFLSDFLTCLILLFCTMGVDSHILHLILESAYLELFKFI